MSNYVERQYAWLIITLTVASAIIIFILYYLQIGRTPLTTNQFLLFMALLIVILLNFYQMKTVVSDQQIELRYGVGLIRRTIAMDDIIDPICVKNKWYHGAGIRQMQGGKLYSLNFTSAVEVHYRFRKFFIRIGSSDPQRLKEEITKRLK